MCGMTARQHSRAPCRSVPPPILPSQLPKPATTPARPTNLPIPPPRTAPTNLRFGIPHTNRPPSRFRHRTPQSRPPHRPDSAARHPFRATGNTRPQACRRCDKKTQKPIQNTPQTVSASLRPNFRTDNPFKDNAINAGKYVNIIFHLTHPLDRRRIKVETLIL